MNRKTSREAVMKIVYQTEFNGMYDQKFMSNIKNRFNKDEYDIDYMTNILDSFMTNFDTVDNYIKSYLKGWTLNRIAKVDLAVLRVALCEMLYLSDIPVSVTINEAVELTKKYSDVKSSKFINGILGSINKAVEKDTNG